jgi:hypothetical protein
MSYIDELKKELEKRNVKKQVIDEIIGDHEDMIREAMSEGLSETDLQTKFGDPSRLAAELAEASNREAPISEPSGDAWKTFAMDSAELSLEVKLVNENATVRLCDGNEITVHCDAPVSRLKEYECSYQNGLLSLHAPRTKGFSLFGSGSNDHSFELFVPRSALVVSAKLTTVNGDAVCVGLDASQFESNTTNGDLHVSSGVIGRLRFNTVNGDVRLEQVEIGSVQGSSVAADVSIQSAKIKGDLILNSVSGDADIHDSVADYAELSTVSGDMNGIEFYPVRIALKSVSGDIRIANKRRDAVEVVRRSTVSGSIEIGGPR